MAVGVAVGRGAESTFSGEAGSGAGGVACLGLGRRLVTVGVAVGWGVLGVGGGVSLLWAVY